MPRSQAHLCYGSVMLSAIFCFSVNAQDSDSSRERGDRREGEQARQEAASGGVGGETSARARPEGRGGRGGGRPEGRGGRGGGRPEGRGGRGGFGGPGGGRPEGRGL